MKTVSKISGLFLSLIVGCLFFTQSACAECPECLEVAKGKIPGKFLDASLKSHPAGFKIWDINESMQALKDRNGKYLWVDTRPGSFLKIGTVKNAVHLVCDQKGTAVPEDKHGPEITKDRLMTAIAKIDSDAAAVKVIFFCQGPKCHRSYNAALRAIDEYGLNPDNIVWFRAGYPNLEKHITSNPKLKRRVQRYLQGDITSL
jgi:hypothetical protein